MRVNYRYYGTYKQRKETLHDFELVSMGEKIDSRANNDGSASSLIISGDATVNYSSLSNGSSSLIVTSGNWEYSSPILDLAMEFAHEMGDHAFIRYLLKFEKYFRAAYEAEYKRNEVPYRAYRDKKYYEDKERQIEKQIEKIQLDSKLSASEQKKKIIIKRKELKEIQNQSKRSVKSYLYKYAKLMKKNFSRTGVLAKTRRFERSFIDRYSNILQTIQTYMLLYQYDLFEKVEMYDPDFKGIKKYYIVPEQIDGVQKPVIINQKAKSKLFEELRQQFYTSKTNSQKK